MEPDIGRTARSTTLVVMGVSGSGKTTVAVQAATRLGWVFAEGDDFHSDANRAKMAGGHPLDDDDRWPWLRAVATWIGEREAAAENAVVTCSALKRSYRDLLDRDHPSVLFVHVTATPEVLRTRLEQRQGHYMPASLLTSQLETLEPLGPDEPGVVLPGQDSAEHTVTELLRLLAARSGHAGRVGAFTPRLE